MQIALYILLGVVIGILLVVVGFKLALRWFVRRVAKFAETQLAHPLPPPHRITLEGATDTNWTGEDGIRNRIEALKSHGFEETGVFVMRELPGQKMVGLVHRDSCTLASVYHLPSGPMIDLVCQFSDGTGFTVADRSEGGALPRPASHPSRRFPGVTAGDLYQRFLAERPAGALKTVSPEVFKERFEKAYADHMNWLAERGGYTMEEMRQELSPEAQASTTDDMMREMRHQAATGFFKYWWKLQGEAPIPFDRVEDDLIVIHDDLSPGQLAAIYNEACELDEDDDNEDDEKNAAAVKAEDVPAGSNARASMALLNASRGAKLRKVWEKTTSMPADFYLPPVPVE